MAVGPTAPVVTTFSLFELSTERKLRARKVESTIDVKEEVRDVYSSEGGYLPHREGCVALRNGEIWKSEPAGVIQELKEHNCPLKKIVWRIRPANVFIFLRLSFRLG